MDLEKIVLAPVGKSFTISGSFVSVFDSVFKRGSYATLFCPRCKGERNFTFIDIDNTERDFSDRRCGPERHRYIFSCACGEKLEVSFVKFKDRSITKVGQYPDAMLYDRGLNNKAIHSVMSDEQKQDYICAIESHARGLDVGAFEYLRRVFVSMVEDAKRSFLEQNPKEKEGFANLAHGGIKDIIKRLVRAGELDSIFQEQGFTIIYPLLSDGVHNRTNEECANYYDVLKEGVELIAQRNYDLKERQKRTLEMSKALGKIPSELEKAKNDNKLKS